MDRIEVLQLRSVTWSFASSSVRMNCMLPAKVQEQKEPLLGGSDSNVESAQLLQQRLFACRAHSDEVSLNFVPVLESQSVRFEESADLLRTPGEQFLTDRHQNTGSVIAEDRSLGDGSQVLILGDSNRQAIQSVHVQHDMNIRTAIAYIDQAVVPDGHPTSQVIV